MNSTAIFRVLRYAAPALSALAVLLSVTTTYACGVPPPGSPPGLGCTDAEQATALRFRSIANYTFSSTRLTFGDGKKADATRDLVAFALEWRATPRLAFQASFGLLLRGELVLPAFADSATGKSEGSASHSFVSGQSFGLSASYRLVEEGTIAPVCLLTGTLGFATAKTRIGNQANVAYNAADLRLGVLAGKTIADALSLYAVARLFGGPIAWRIRGESVTGTDLYKYQFGAGASLQLFRRVDLFVEGIPLGERLLTLGAAFSY